MPPTIAISLNINIGHGLLSLSAVNILIKGLCNKRMGIASYIYTVHIYCVRIIQYMKCVTYNVQVPTLRILYLSVVVDPKIPTDFKITAYMPSVIILYFVWFVVELINQLTRPYNNRYYTMSVHTTLLSIKPVQLDDVTLIPRTVYCCAI